MLCDLCGEKDASMFVHHLIGSRKVELHLCSACAERRGLGGGDPRKPELIQSLIQNLPPVDAESAGTDPSPIVRNCPFCGASFKELAAKGLLGCFSCGDLFAADLLKAKGGMNGTVSDAPPIGYRGRLSYAVTRSVEDRRDRASLREQLDRAVAGEDYESAAQLRDRIRSMEGPGGPHG
jgi:protein arginine kinase activator